MSDTSGDPWLQNNPHKLRFWGEANFTGIIMGGILYGVVTVLFFRCMVASCKPVNGTRKGIKWGLVAYTIRMFSLVTIFTATNLQIQSISYIDRRGSHHGSGISHSSPSEPLGHQLRTHSHSKAVSICHNLVFLLNRWLADGLLLYRCHLIYSMNRLATALPCLVYLASLVMGVMLIHQTSQPGRGIWDSEAIRFGLPYFSGSVSLNILLTLMIVTRLTLRIIIRNTTGTLFMTSGLCQAVRAIVMMLVESSALYTVTSLLSIAPWGARSHVADLFFPILAETQVIASLLVIRRFADRSAVMSNPTVSRSSGPFGIGSHGKSTSGGEALSGEYPINPMDPYGITSGMLIVGVETTIDVHHDRG